MGYKTHPFNLISNDKHKITYLLHYIKGYFDVTSKQDKMLAKRIPKDIELLKKNKTNLEEKGIYFHFFEDDITRMLALITPRPKQDNATGLVSPYTGGFFLFEVKFPQDYPMSPPKLDFHPKTHLCRFHPNYYSNGKVCLSIINTWANADWSPSMSLMALLITLEERFFEKALGCEPGLEQATTATHKQYNDVVEYYKYKVSIIDVIYDKHPMYVPFKDTIKLEFEKTKDWHLARIHSLLQTVQGKHLMSPRYGCSAGINYEDIRNNLQLLYPSV